MKHFSEKRLQENFGNVNNDIRHASDCKSVSSCRKEQRKTEEKAVNEHSIEQQSINANVEMAIGTTSATTSAISRVETPVSVASLVNSSATVLGTSIVNVERDNVTTVETKSQLAPITSVKKPSNISGKPVAVVKTNATQSLLQSNQHNFPHHQIQVSTSAGLQTIRLSGHSVLQSAQQSVSAGGNTSATNGVTTNLAILPSTKTQNQQQQQPTVVTNQAAKSILQTTNMKQQQSQQQQQQQQQQHVLPGKTLLASQIKLVSSSQIKSLLTSHGLQGQTIFIKQSSPSSNQSQQQQLQQQQQQQQQQQLKVFVLKILAFVIVSFSYLQMFTSAATAATAAAAAATTATAATSTTASSCDSTTTYTTNSGNATYNRSNRRKTNRRTDTTVASSSSSATATTATAATTKNIGKSFNKQQRRTNHLR